MRRQYIALYEKALHSAHMSLLIAKEKQLPAEARARIFFFFMREAARWRYRIFIED